MLMWQQFAQSESIGMCTVEYGLKGKARSGRQGAQRAGFLLGDHLRLVIRSDKGLVCKVYKALVELQKNKRDKRNNFIVKLEKEVNRNFFKDR